MSGAFEVAASAFAVVGVADVLVRAGRDLCNFLNDIEDAPNIAKRLCDVVAETLLLAAASKRCLQQYKSQVQAAHIIEIESALQAALKALGREVKSLKTLTTKLKGNSKRWSNIRYVLGEQRINKALDNLQQSKLSIIVALTAACRESNSIENQQVKDVIQQALLKAADLEGAVNTRLEATEHVIASQLNTFQQQNLATQKTCQRAVDAKLDIQHRGLTKELAKVQKLQQNTLGTIYSAQRSAASSQDKLLRVSRQNDKRTARLSRDVQAHTDLIIATIKDLQVAPASCVSKAASSRRQIVYSGEQRDLIVPALYYAKKQLATVFDRIFAEHHQDTSLDHVIWLRSELQNLVESAAQEEASTHPMSTATSFDTWIYPEERQRSPQDPKRSNTRSANGGTFSTAGNERHEALFPKHRTRKSSDQHMSFETSSGTVRIHVPRRRAGELNAAVASDEVSLVLTSTAGEPFVALYARFTRVRNRFRAPGICAQLQIILPLETDQLRYYRELIQDGSIQDFDEALRSGIISPYRCTLGHDLINVFSIAAACERADIFSHLESQGVGYSALQQDTSVCLGLVVSQRDMAKPNSDMINAVLGYCADPLAVLPDIIILILSSEGDIEYFDFWPFLNVCLKRLLTIDGSTDLRKLGVDPENLQWPPETIPGIIRYLLQTGADATLTLFGNVSLLHLALKSEMFQQCVSMSQAHSIRTQIISALIEAGVYILSRDVNGDTVSEVARRMGHWKLWCEALQENGKSIEDITRQQKQEWLLDDANFQDDGSGRYVYRKHLDSKADEDSLEGMTDGKD